MADNLPCVYCGKPVDTIGGTEEYIITNKDQGVPTDQWAYAHLDCHTPSHIGRLGPLSSKGKGYHPLSPKGKAYHR